jgi:hypothetical protein
MPVTAAEVAELRQAGQALSLDDVDNTLKTQAEVVGYLIHSARSMGANQAEQLHVVELLIRAVEMDRENVREVRNTLSALGYGHDLAVLLTSLSRKAKPKPPSWIERRRARLPLK